MKTYAAINKDDKIRGKSSSGGIFSVLALQFDVIYGVAMTSDCYGAEMVRIEGKKDIESIRGSKYLQARLGDIFKQVKIDLLEGKKVLFSGTGCQINGLNLFLGKPYSNICCVDVICHGVPSPKLWREYIKYQENKYGKLEKVNFRCKDNGWNNFGIKENSIYISKEDDPYMKMFLRNYCLRPACYECHAKYYKTADITIADFWGIEKIAPEMNDGRGTSLVIIRTKKGDNVFENIKDAIEYKEVNYKDGIRENPSEYNSVERPKMRDSFFADLNNISFSSMIAKYAGDSETSMLEKYIRKVKLGVKKIMKKKGGG